MSCCVEEYTSFEAIGLLFKACASYHCIIILLLVLFANFIVLFQFISLEQVFS